MRERIPSSFIRLPYALERAAPRFETNAIKSPESLLRTLIGRYSKPGARVFDPFAGLGTTLFVAAEMGRKPYGIEFDRRRYEWVAGQLSGLGLGWESLIYGDARRLAGYGLPKMDFVFTCPPYMKATDRRNRLDENEAKAGSYAGYLRQMRDVFGQVAGLMKRGAHAVVQLDNLPGRVYTPLVRDVGMAVEASLRLEGEIVVAWDGARPEYLHTQCLVFRKV